MSHMKRWLEQISIEIGEGGEINDKVLAESQRRLNQGTEERDPDAERDLHREAVCSES